MSTVHDLPATLRNRSGSGLLGQMRREGLTPAVFYGKDVDAKNIKVDTKVLFDLLHHAASEHLLVNLNVEGDGQHLALIQEVQHAPLSGEILHVDFLAVKRGEKLNSLVPLVLTGTAKGTKAGGVLNLQLNELSVQCLPTDLPETIEVDVTALEIGDSVHVSDLKLPKGVETDVEAEVVVAHVSPPTLEEETEEGEGDQPTEPEVMGKGKDDGEEEESSQS